MERFLNLLAADVLRIFRHQPGAQARLYGNVAVRYHGLDALLGLFGAGEIGVKYSQQQTADRQRHHDEESQLPEAVKIHPGSPHASAPSCPMTWRQSAARRIMILWAAAFAALTGSGYGGDFACNRLQ